MITKKQYMIGNRVLGDEFDLMGLVVSLEAERDAKAQIAQLENRVKAADELADAVEIWQRDGLTVEAAIKMGAVLSIYRSTGEQT